jgi:hypothetical protein
MIKVTGFDFEVFASLCAHFASVFDSNISFVLSRTLCFEREKQKNKGRKQLIFTDDCLCLVLTWT